MGISSKSSPSSLIPGTRKHDHRRFKAITIPCKWVEAYRPDGKGYYQVVLAFLYQNILFAHSDIDQKPEDELPRKRGCVSRIGFTSCRICIV
ncbi:hypothetical protein F4861DRAFT_339923 [Xylaria intraflava]|nr:hypothetical protein F4861DRAFT_339923 [Xylaria intraflava]